MGVLEQAPLGLPQEIHTHMNTHSIPPKGTKGHCVIEIVSELWGWRDGRDTQTNIQRSYSTALTDLTLILHLQRLQFNIKSRTKTINWVPN